MTKDNPFRKAISARHNSEGTASRQQSELDESDSVLDISLQPEAASPPVLEVPPIQVPTSEPKKRGRPATGKRSDDAWIGRTFYIQRATDLDIEGELLNLKRQGFELDKSELVDKLLSAWVQWRNGKDSDFLFSEISPIQKAKDLEV